MFEKQIFNELFNFLEDKNLISIHQSGFRPGDSCIYQLFPITHGIFSSFECNPTLETLFVFLDIFRGFDRVWHDGFLFKFKQNGVSGNAFQLIKRFLNGKFQSVLLNGQASDWETIQAGVPEGSILEPLFFLFAGDTSSFSGICDPLETANVLNNDLREIRKWTEQWKIFLTQVQLNKLRK